MDPINLKNLRRYPDDRLQDPTLQAWSATDELLIAEVLTGSAQTPPPGKLLILNDQWGALTSALSELRPVTFTDSYLSTRAIEQNLGERLSRVRLEHDLGALTRLTDAKQKFQTVLIVIPKNLSYFEDLLIHARPLLSEEAQVIAGYPVKYHTAESFNLLAKWIGPTRTSLAKKKARLIFAMPNAATPEAAAGAPKNPYPLEVDLSSEAIQFTERFINHSNVFSREKLDVGTRFLLEHLPQKSSGAILDLGCGNGIVGIAAQKLSPLAKLTFCDESWMAIQSAETNFARNFSSPLVAGRIQKPIFVWTHALDGLPAEARFDWILCNPPFHLHQGTAMGDATARAMYQGAIRALNPGGRLRVIGNTGLGYANILGEWMGQAQGTTEIVARNRKFTIVDAVMP